MYTFEDFFFHELHQEFTGKDRKDTETVFLLVPGTGWGTASTEEKLYGASFLSLLQGRSIRALGETTRPAEEEEGKSLLGDA